VGLAAASGIRPFLPLLLAGALAKAGDLGVSFAGKPFHFLGSAAWLLVVTVALIVSYLIQVLSDRPATEERPFAGGDPFASALTGIALGSGALLFAGTLAAHGDTWWPGLIAGLLCAFVGERASGPLIARVRARLTDRSARNALTVYLDATALIASLVVCAFHPLGYVLLLLLIWWLVRAGRRDGERYAGLRILGR
jgi:hypothetical protein